MVLFVSITPLVSFGQCTYPGTATSVGTYTFCIDYNNNIYNNNTITTTTVNAGQYALLNVVKGFTYTFSVGDVFKGKDENLTVYDSSSNAILIGNKNNNGCTISNWTSTISGQVKILLSEEWCFNDSSAGGGALSLTLNSLGDTQDSQTAYGTNSWIGHIYNSVGSAPEPFTTATNYAGYYTVGTETINETFGGDNVCFSVLSNGISWTSIYTDQFAVRYRMLSTRAAGYYFMNAHADDGIRATVDGVTVLSNWSDNLDTQYCNNLIYLTGSSNIIVDYYEKSGFNVVGVNFAAITGNSISSYADINVCSGASPSLDGSNLLSCTGTTNTTYQWQSSTDNVTFTNISGATAEDCTPPAAVTTTTVDVKYYRRVLKAFGVPITVSNPATGSVKVITNPAPAAPGSITGATTQCAGNTLQTYSVAAVANATSYNWTLPTNWTITAGTGTNSITVSIASNGATGNVSVDAINGCGIGYSPYQWVTVSSPTVAGTVTPANTNVCSWSNTNLSLSGQTGSILRWESSTDNFAGGPITTIASTGSSITASNVTVDTYYRAVVQNGGCNILNTSSVKLTVANPGGISVNGVFYPLSGNTTNCASTTMTFSIAAVANATSYTWVVGTGWTIVSGQGTTTVLVTTGTTSQSNNISVYPANACSSAYLWVALTNTATPTGTAAQSFCSGATVANLSASGTTIQWYAASSGGSPLVTTTSLVNATHYYATQTVNGCESTTRFDVTATVTAIPSAPTIGTTTQPTCSIATGSVVLNSLPAGNWMLTRSPGSVTTLGSGISTTIAGLAAGTTYTYLVNNLNNGLKGEYFNTMDLTGSPVLTRTDATVNFDWASGSPDSSINVDNFSVRWSGLIQPLYTETYTFSTNSDDGIRLWVNGVQVINNWTIHAATINTGTISLTAGVKYNIVLEFYDNTGGAVSQLSWSSPSQVSQIIPTTQLYSVSSCGSPASTNVVINAQPATPAIPTIGTITQPDCVTATGSFTITNYSGSYTYTATPATGVTISGNTVTAPAGSYTIIATLGSCSSVASSSVVINPAITNTWTVASGVGSWSNGTPDSTQKLVFASNYPPATDPNVDLFGCSCTVNTGVSVILNSARTMTITNGVTVSGTGTLTFDYDQTFGANPINSASLVQLNNVVTNNNSGKINYNRMTNTAVISTDYTYWSSPVLPQTLGELSKNQSLSSNYYSFDVPSQNWKQESPTTSMVAGIGYIVGGPKSTSAVSTYLAPFYGVPNNGAISLAGTIVPDSFYLLGNPYPSAINADTFLNENAAVLNGTLYFWTHNTAMQDRNLIGNNPDGSTKAGSGAYAYTQDDYASYNITGGVVGIAPDITAKANSLGGNTNIPSGKIAAGQGFFASSLVNPTGSAIVYNNDIRVAGTTSTIVNNSQFFKTSNTKGKTTNAVEKHRVWLSLSNSQGAFKQALVGYVTGATNEYDSRFDGESFDGNEFVDFYSINQDKNLVIQGRAMPFDETDEVPLGYRTTIDGAFTINIDQADGLLADQAIFIEDKLTNTIFDLKSGAYAFTTIAGTFNDRFILRYTSKTLGTKNFDTLENTVVVSNTNKQIKINSSVEMIDKVLVYDLLGRQIYQKTKVNSNEFSILSLTSSHQTLIVKTVLQNGKTVTEKIIY